LPLDACPTNKATSYQTSQSRYNNWLIAKLINVFADVERREEREESLALMQASSWA